MDADFGDAVVNRARMESGLIYDPGHPDLADTQTEALELLHDYNATRPSQASQRQALLRRMFASVGEGCQIEPPFHANWGGRHVHLGSSVYANFNLTLVDDGPIFIGDNVMFGPGVVVTTAGHPLLPELRHRRRKCRHQGPARERGGRRHAVPGREGDRRP